MAVPDFQSLFIPVLVASDGNEHNLSETIVEYSTTIRAE